MTPEEEIKFRSRRGFLTGALGLGAALAGWRWLSDAPRQGGVKGPLRQVHEGNAKLWQSLRGIPHQIRTFEPSQATEPRVNGKDGLSDDFDPLNWRLQVEGLAGKSLSLTLEEIRRLTHRVVTVPLTCIEGWSTVVSWGGIRLADFAERYVPQAGAAFVGAFTPDGGYYVGLDLASALHPQTLLCYEMNGQPLSLGHGAPLRLVVPTKYGIKSLKRLGTLAFTRQRPADFWAERGYDYDSGL